MFYLRVYTFQQVLVYVIFANSCSPWSIEPVEKMTAVLLVKKRFGFDGTRKLIAVFTRPHHWILF
jgi:hypothetical protein